MSRQIRRDYRKAAVSPQDRTMLEYVEKLARERWTVTAEDHERLHRVGFTDADILDITLVVANFMLANTLTDAFGLEYHENLHHIFVEDSVSLETPLPTATGASALETLFPGDEVWLNSPPISPDALSGRPVLLYYWDWTQAASLDGLPYLSAWHARYAAYGLVALLILAPEFPFAKEPGAASGAVRRLGIALPVVLAPSFRTWQGANNAFWPVWHVIDSQGTLRFRHHGSGGYQRIEGAVQAVSQDGVHQTVPDVMEPLAPLHRPGTRVFEPTTQLYAVYDKGRLGHPEAAGVEGRIVDFVEPKEKTPGILYVDGQWQVRPDGLQLAGDRGTLTVRYQGAGVVAVLGHPGAVAGATIRLDGATPGAAAGRDVRDGRVQLDDPRLYEIIRGPFGAHELRVESATPGLTIYAMTFLPGLSGEPGPWPVRVVE
ncbi:MAG: hypothetical protein ACT4P5_09715 [Armatimonadota bacterium]